MRSFLPARRRGSVIVVMTASAAVAALAFKGFGAGGTEIEAAASSAPTPTIALTQMDGTPPFDPSTSLGGDSGSSNGIVRSGDRVAFVVDIDSGATGIANATVTLPIWKGLSIETVPDFCRPDSRLVDAGVTTVLTCTLGDLAPNARTTRVVALDASAAPGTAIATWATLSGTSPITFVMSNATRLQFAQRPAGCDPRGVDAALDPAVRPSTDAVRASGRIADVVLDESGTPVPGAVVTLAGQDRCGHIINRQITTSETGSFAFVGLVAGVYHVSTAAPRTTPLRPDWRRR
ncbi:carboxypeptidase-like regulatory domain-containing protein [Prescottella defluvii]|nr:carboxypeptidase-like regulatory domain-containing protein [Prescottella defluvii]